jgi:hypothetical protein
MRWDGRYFVTYGLPDGRVIRQDAAKPVPGGNVTILATDNGMRERDRSPAPAPAPE